MVYRNNGKSKPFLRPTINIRLHVYIRHYQFLFHFLTEMEKTDLKSIICYVNIVTHVCTCITDSAQYVGMAPTCPSNETAETLEITVISLFTHITSKLITP